MTVVKDSIRRQLVILARRSKSRTTAFSREIPTDWHPSQVRNPNGVLDPHFTDASAWEVVLVWRTCEFSVC